MLYRLLFSPQYQKAFQWCAKRSMFHLHNFITIISLFSPSPLHHSPLPSEYMGWSECLFFNCVVILSHYLQTHCAVYVLKHVFCISCGNSQVLIHPWFLGEFIMWCQAEENIFLQRQTFQDKIVSGTKRITEIGWDLSGSSYPVPRLQHWLLHHLPRDWLSLQACDFPDPTSCHLKLMIWLKWELEHWRVRSTFLQSSETSSAWHGLSKIIKNIFLML